MPDSIHLPACIALILLGIGERGSVSGQSVSEGPKRVAQAKIEIESPANEITGANTPAESATKSSESSDDDFRQWQIELENVHRTYSSWGLSREKRVYSRQRISPDEDAVASDLWSNEIPSDILNERFLREDNQFRSDCMDPPLLRRVFAFDGITGRIRDSHRLQNGPLLNLTAAHENDFTIQLPHTALVDYFYAPNLSPIFHKANDRAMVNTSRLIGEPKVVSQSVDGHPCWKLTFRTVSEEDGRAIIWCNVFLARDRALLPLRQNFQATYGASRGVATVIRTDEFHKDPHSGLWYPKKVTGIQRSKNHAQLARFSFQVSDLQTETTLYSKAMAIAPAHIKPPQAVVANYAPLPVLTDLPGPGSNSMTVTHSFRGKIAGGGAIVAAVIFTAISLCLRKTRLGRILRDFIGRNRATMGITGMVATACAGLLASYPPGWTTNGLAMMAVGLVGIGWIGLSMLVVGDKRMSIKMALFAAACSAIFFGGYSMGIKRMQVRQRMIREVRDEGGQVDVGQWRLDEDGLFLPKSMRHLLGEAWSGRANRAAIAEGSFTERNVENWCLDEVQWLGIASRQDAPFRVDSDALAKIDDTDALWILHAEGGYLDDAAFKELRRFNRLIDIYYDCQHRMVSPEITRLPTLERLWLTNAVVDEALFQTLRKVKELDFITLIKPRIGSISAPAAELGLQAIEIRNANLDSKDLISIGNLPLDLQFVDCKFNLAVSDGVSLAATKTLTFKASDLNNQSLLKLAESPNLKQIQLTGTNVSQDGIDAFSSVRPEVMLTLK